MSSHINYIDFCNVWYLAKDENDEPIGLLFVPDDASAYPPPYNISIMILGKKVTLQGPLTDSERETYEEFNLFPRLTMVDSKHSTARNHAKFAGVHGFVYQYQSPGGEHEISRTIPLPSIGQLLK